MMGWEMSRKKTTVIAKVVSIEHQNPGNILM